MESQIDALSFSVINLIIVFVVLLILQGVIQLIKFVAYKKPDDSTGKKTSVTEPVEPVDQTKDAAPGESVSERNIQVKAAAVCAAIAASMDGKPHRIVQIRRLTPQSMWIQSARMENITSNAMLRHRRESN
ncbi:MAG: OadG family protein [Thermoactinomyces sp.]